MGKAIEINESKLRYGFGIIKEISTFRPHSSISFQSSEQIREAFAEIKQLAKWGMGKNRSKMKQTVSKIIGSIEAQSPGDPVNLNLTEYEHKSIKALLKLIRRSLNNDKDGVILN